MDFALKGRQNSADAIRVTSIPGEQFSNSYNILPEEAYCSALDINCGDGEPRFPWQCDVAIQCDLISSLNICKSSKTASQPSNASLMPDQHLARNKHENIVSGIRFWKSSSILGTANTDDSKKQTTSHSKKKHHKSVLQRAASFDSRGYSRLVQTSSPNSPTFADGNGPHLYVPHHIQTFKPNHETTIPGSLAESTHYTNKERRNSETGSSSAPNSRSGTPPLTPPFSFYQKSIKTFNHC